MRAEFVQSDLYKSTQFISLIHLHLSIGFPSHSKVMPKSSMIHFPLTASFNPHSSLSFLILPSAFLLGHLCIYSSLYVKHTSSDTPKAHDFISFMSFLKCISVKLSLTTLTNDHPLPWYFLLFSLRSHICLTFDIFYLFFLLIILSCEGRYLCFYFSLIYPESRTVLQ